MKTIAIITSDPESVNYEILKKSLFFFTKKKNNRYLFIGSKKLFLKNIKTKIKINFFDINYKNCKNKRIYLQKSFDAFCKLYKEKKVHALINLPLNKKNFFLNEFPGVTEYLSHKFKKTGMETMLLYNEKFSVSPVTTHINISKISQKLSKKKIIINFLNIFNFYKKFLKIKKPKIGLIGLNPHNGKDFMKQNEEEKIIIPALNQINQIFRNNIYGLISPDFSFITREQKKLNCLMGMYHDQVLTTFKYINKYSAINITLGLPFLRMSPDHGTANDIIGKNKANPKSFLYCLNFFEKFHKSI